MHLSVFFQLFNGNDDADTIVMHKFNRRLAARFIRFNPRSWTSMICMRVDIYACELPIAKSTSTAPPTTIKGKLYAILQLLFIDFLLLNITECNL